MQKLAGIMTTLYRSPDPENIYAYSPGICILPNGRLVATMDQGGPGVKNLSGVKGIIGKTEVQGKIYLSDDEGKTWRHVTDTPMQHARPFVAGNSVYVLGHAGDLVIVRSDDHGETWSEPVTLTQGQSWHQAPCNVHYAKGNVYLVMERKMDYVCKTWPVSILAPILMRAFCKDDLTKVESWTFASEICCKEAGGFIHLINSGAACVDANCRAKDENGNPTMKEWYNVTDADQKAIMENVEWCPADNGYFRGGGYSSRFVTKAEIPCTMIRLNMIKGLGPVLQIAEGWTVDLPDEVTDTLWKRTDYTWPCTWFAPRCDGREGSPSENAYEVMNHWGANNGAISYGHIGADLITLCSMLRIPVCMHNVPEKDIFRPAVWNAFGSDKEGQDYRACAAFGPTFKK